jgi:hypothetical protein
MQAEDLQPGQQVRITQTIERREGDWQHVVEGVVESVEYRPTGSWYAHGKDDRYWLRRVRLRKPDGELTTLTIDVYTQVEVLGGNLAT